MGKRNATKLPPLKDPSEIPDDKLDAAYQVFRKRTKSWPEAKRQAAYLKWQAAFERRRANDLRRICNLFSFFWRARTRPACATSPAAAATPPPASIASGRSCRSASSSSFAA